MSDAEALSEAGRTLLGLVDPDERADLRERVAAAVSRGTRADTVVCVVGEFKQGKSSLVNSLLRQQVCPVDDDLATSVITMIHYGEEPRGTVRRRDGEETVSEAITVDEVGEWASEQGNPDNAKAVDRVDIALPAAILKDGLMLVDTPGMGGLGGGHAAATMAFLPFADGLVLVSDTSSELTAPEAAFLKQAISLCPTVMLAQTKTDLYPQSERIIELDRQHLETSGVEVPTVAVSSHLRDVALETRDRELNLTSGFPELLDVLQRQVVTPARDASAERAVSELRGVAGQIRSGVEEALRLLDDPAEREAAVAKLQDATQRLEHLRGPGARWSTVLGDRITDLQTSVAHGFRGEMRIIGRDMDERVEGLTRGADWEAVTRDAQTAVSEASATAYGTIQRAWGEIHVELAKLLQAEDLVSFDTDRTAREQADLGSFWAGTEAVNKSENAGLAAGRSLIGLAQTYGSSQFMFMNLSAVSKFGVSLAGLAAGPVVAGGFVVMGGLKVFDDRKRRVTDRKQKLRSQIRAFVDNVQFEVGDDLANMIRDAQRALRDEFLDRIGELQATYAQTIQEVQQDAKRSEQELVARRTELTARLASLDDVDRLLAEVGS
ncbi:MAG: dynamin family protein [Actinomycetota bacterium]